MLNVCFCITFIHIIEGSIIPLHICQICKMVLYSEGRQSLKHLPNRVKVPGETKMGNLREPLNKSVWLSIQRKITCILHGDILFQVWKLQEALQHVCGNIFHPESLGLNPPLLTQTGTPHSFILFCLKYLFQLYSHIFL